MTRDGPHPVDIHVGKRIVEIRSGLGLTQSDIARHLGLTFQQVQKYEKGSNRISASKLFAIASLLQVDIAALFTGLGKTAVPEATAAPHNGDTMEMISLVQTLPVGLQRLALDLIRTLGPSDPR
ncbi:helix-turn-helix domain-containing protein [Brevundimonas sp.]|uniref:helix-turn-helix domain-containing protein n=1 Tax=Brevundimonas sp. TaxID=1871086 RepID=UPI003BA99EEA